MLEINNRISLKKTEIKPIENDCQLSRQAISETENKFRKFESAMDVAVTEIASAPLKETDG